MNTQIVSVFSSIIQAVASVVALILSVIAIRQTNKSIKSANRPQISAYADFINLFNDPTEYLIIKNFGKSSAIIDSIEINPPMAGQAKIYGVEYFHGLVGSTIVPNQSLTYVYSSNVFSHDSSVFDERNLTITVLYHDDIDKYQGSFYINNSALVKGLSFTKPSSKNPMDKQFAEVSEEFLRKHL